MRKALLLFAGLLIAVTSVAAEERPIKGEAGLAPLRQGDASGGIQEEVKDPLQFGPLKTGLDAMLRGESATSFSLADYTFTPNSNESRLLLRVRPSLTFTPAEYLAARIEGQWYAFHGDTDYDKVRLYQGYLEGSLPGKRVVLKAGRQELVYGSTFVLGGDSFFDGLSYDAVKLRVRPVDSLAIDLFAGKYSKDNSDGIRGELYGAHGTYRVSDDLAVDLYGFLDTGGEGLIHNGRDEKSYSIGARIAGKLGTSITFEAEPVYQFGRHVEASSHHEISAFGGHADLAIDHPIGRHPGRGFIGYAFGSGDGAATEGGFTEFHNPNNDTALIGDMSVIGDLSGVTAIDQAGNEVHASGLHVVTVGGGVDLSEKLNLSLDGHYFRAVKTPAGISKDVGIETNLILTWNIIDNVALNASANRFFTGGFFKDATGSGKEINYGYLQAQANF